MLIALGSVHTDGDIEMANVVRESHLDSVEENTT